MCSFALAVWLWSNFVNGWARSSRRVVRINVDETGIRLLRVLGRSLVTCVARQAQRSARGLERHATKHDARGMVTVATLICNGAAV